MLGSPLETIRFIGLSSMTVTGGAGNAVLYADGGTNTFTAGKGGLNVTGGTGADSYIVHVGAGALNIADFSVAKGDSLTIDSSLKAAMRTQSDGSGGTLLVLPGSTGRVDLQGVASFQTSAIHWA